MNILFLADNFFPEHNAPANRTYEHAKHWVRAGHEVTVITCAPNFPEGRLYPGYKNSWYKVEIIDGIRVVRVKTFIVANKGFVLRILDYLSFMIMGFLVGLFQKRPEILVATSPQFFCAVAGWMLSVCKWRPFIFEVRDLWPESIVEVGAMRRNFMIKLLEKLELFLYRRAKAIVTATTSLEKDLVRRGISSEKITTILNGVDLSFFANKKIKDSELLAKYNLQNKFVVGYIGTHGMAHDLGNVLDAAKLLHNRPDIVFMLVGTGADKQHLLKRAREEEIDNVLFVEPQPRAAIVNYWGLCDVALVHLKNIPLFATAVPSKIFEAMAIGLPILMVAPQAEGGELVIAEGIGEMIVAGDPQLLADTIIEWQCDRVKLALFAKNCEQAITKYTRAAAAEQMLEVFKSIS